MEHLTERILSVAEALHIMYEHCAVLIMAYFNQSVNALNRVIGLEGTLFHAVQRLGTSAPKTGEGVLTHNYEAESDSPATCPKN